MIQPRFIRREVVLVFELFERWIVEGPHALFCGSGEGSDKDERGD